MDPWAEVYHHELDRVYRASMQGLDKPGYIEMQIPGIGFVKAVTGKALQIDEEEATPEQVLAVAAWFNDQLGKR